MKAQQPVLQLQKLYNKKFSHKQLVLVTAPVSTGAIFIAYRNNLSLNNFHRHYPDHIKSSHRLTAFYNGQNFLLGQLSGYTVLLALVWVWCGRYKPNDP